MKMLWTWTFPGSWPRHRLYSCLATVYVGGTVSARQPFPFSLGQPPGHSNHSKSTDKSTSLPPKTHWDTTRLSPLLPVLLRGYSNSAVRRPAGGHGSSCLQFYHSEGCSRIATCSRPVWATKWIQSQPGTLSWKKIENKKDVRYTWFENWLWTPCQNPWCLL